MSAPLFVAGWGLWLTALATLLWIWSGDELPAGLLAGAAAGWLLIAGYLALRPRDPSRSRMVVESSLATVVLVLGLVMIVNGLAFGEWLMLIGLEVTLLGIAGLVVELRDLRRSRRASE